ncbi:MAG: 4-hydroxy-tetrahydrodipicolinate synthase [Candidatus Omnitrophota bacterium]|jgi:4-hydroxy-tetrahydrodipicolinate synthase
MKLRGSIVALITPFKSGKVDVKALRDLVIFHIKSGTHGIVPCGTTGESPTLSHDEHKRVISIVIETVNKRVPVIAGTGSNSTNEAVELTRYAKKAGADATLSVVPYYNKPTQQGMYEHFSAIATKAKLPIVLYNIPGRCGTALTPDTIVRLSKLDEVIAVKEATGVMDMATEIIGRTNLDVLSGDDSLTLPLMALGATGVVSVFANVFPLELIRLVNAIEEADWDQAKRIHYEIAPICKAMFLETNPIPVKTAMKFLKMDSGEMRLPLCSMQKSNEALLKKIVTPYAKRVMGISK